MALYEYTCPACGAFDVTQPMGRAAAVERCPRCGSRSRRRFSTPATTSPGSPLRRAREVADRSAHAPVVSAGPPAWPRRPPNPLHAKLPRP